eukprot:COSAG06_NODE_23691_length_684_cov_0.781197_1_plen_81_part_01
MPPPEVFTCATCARDRRRYHVTPPHLQHPSVAPNNWVTYYVSTLLLQHEWRLGVNALEHRELVQRHNHCSTAATLVHLAAL